MNQNHKVMTDRHCTLLAGPFASFIQGCLALVCISILIVKRQQENPRREWFVWFLDVMKQGIGSSFGHFSNIYLSMLIAQSLTHLNHQSGAVSSTATSSIAAAILATSNSSASDIHPPNSLASSSSFSHDKLGALGTGDECQWYCLTYLVDSTVGTLWNLLCLQLLDCLVNQSSSPWLYRLLNFGDYGHPPQLNIFLAQLVVWLSIVISGKLLIVLLLYQFIFPINAVMNYIFHSLQQEPEVELVIVMIVLPGILNTVQFWVTDTFLKQQLPSPSNTHSSYNSHPSISSSATLSNSKSSLSYRELSESGDDGDSSSYDEEEEEGGVVVAYEEDDVSASPSFLIRKKQSRDEEEEDEARRWKSAKMRKRRGMHSFEYERLNATSPSSSSTRSSSSSLSASQLGWAGTLTKYVYEVLGLRHLVSASYGGTMSQSNSLPIPRGQRGAALEFDSEVEGDGDSEAITRRRKRGTKRIDAGTSSPSPAHSTHPNANRREVAGGGLGSGSGEGSLSLSRTTSRRDDDVI